MQSLGIDVDAKTSTGCLLDEAGEVKSRGPIETSSMELQRLCREQRGSGELIAGQEVGGMAYLVRDALAQAGVPLLSFNAQQMRMIAASRKKTDRRDAYWIGRSLQSGMHPHPVYLPSGLIRELRARLAQRSALQSEQQRWWLRARALLRSLGLRTGSGTRALLQALDGLRTRESIPAYLQESAALYHRQIVALGTELRRADRALHQATQSVDAIQRLQCIPGIRRLSASTLLAWIGEIDRFPSARSLCAYEGWFLAFAKAGRRTTWGGSPRPAQAL